MKKRIISVLMAIISVASITVSGCGDERLAPDYSLSELQFDFYGYSSASTGEWTIDNVKYSAGQDFRTVERIASQSESMVPTSFQ